MKLPFVSRERYNELRAAHDALLEKYHAVLTDYAARQPALEPAKPAKTPRQPRDPLIDNLTADLVGAMGDGAAARAEAERIKREAFGGGL